MGKRANGRRRRALLVGRYPVVDGGHIYAEVWIEFGYCEVPKGNEADLELELDALAAQVPEKPLQFGFEFK